MEASRVRQAIARPAICFSATDSLSVGGPSSIRKVVLVDIENRQPAAEVAWTREGVVGHDDRVAGSRGRGLVAGWGSGQFGLLNDDFSNVLRPAPIPRLRNVTTLSAYQDSGTALYALKADGTVWAWGENFYGELGDIGSKPRPSSRFRKGVRDAGSRAMPKPIAGLRGITAVFPGQSKAWARRADGTVLGWGDWPHGDSGRSEADMHRPLEISALAGVTAIADANHPIWALKSDGTLLGWQWRLQGDTFDRSLPRPVEGISNVSRIAAGGRALFAVRSDGTVWADDEYYGQTVGDGQTTFSRAPGQVPGLDEAIEVFPVPSPRATTFALMDDRTVWAWGSNYSGLLGDGSSESERAAPGRVKKLKDIRMIVPSFGSATALRADGTVWTWGNWLASGNGVREEQAKPAQVRGLDSVAAIASSGSTTWALKDDGTVWAWGMNTFGTIGDGTKEYRDRPVRVPGLGGVSSLTVANGCLFVVMN